MEFFRGMGIPFEWHYVDPPEEVWRERIEKRNLKVLAGTSDKYFVDEGLLEKCIERFEPPEQEEMDIIIR